MHISYKYLNACIVMCIVLYIIVKPRHPLESLQIKDEHEEAAEVQKHILLSDLKEREVSEVTVPPFPRIVHQTWKDYHVPETMGVWMSSWHKYNTDWEYWFWTDQDILNFVTSQFPEFLDLYNGYDQNIMRNDLHIDHSSCGLAQVVDMQITFRDDIF